MGWNNVGEWLKANAGDGAMLVGSLLTGNVPAAIAAGAAIVSSATGKATPEDVLARLQMDPATVVRVKELELQENQNIRAHIQAMQEAELTDEQARHHETQETIRTGDTAEDSFVRRTRPGMAWCGLFGAIAYALFNPTPSPWILVGLLSLPLTYMGWRGLDKTVEAIVTARLGIAAAAAGVATGVVRHK